jgi:hypothetical protein
MENCARCNNQATAVCTRCSIATYCSERCYSLDWTLHKRICGKVYTGNHDDLLWVRGTNTSIFLSCYLSNGKWRLLAKGEQFRRRFVAMMETVDSGISGIGGVNFESISAYSATEIRGSGRYAARTSPYSNKPELVRIKENLRFDPQPWHATLVEIAYSFMRLKQWSGHAEYYPLALRYRRFVNGQYQEQIFEDDVRKLEQLFELFATDVYLPLGWQTLDEVSRRRQVVALLNGIRRQFGYSESEAFDSSLLNEEELQSILQRGIVYLVSADRDQLLSLVVAIKLFLPVRWPLVEALLVNEVHRLLRHAELIKIIYNEAVSNRPPAYAVTEEDRRILEAPIPLIIASTNESIQRTKVRPYDSASELKLPGKIRIGASGANVIVVRRKDKNALKKLLRELPVPITDMQIRVDDTIF